MDIVEYISQNVDPLVLLHHYEFKNIVETDDEIRASCEVHKGNNPTAFVWNKENDLWYCYTGECGGGDAITLVRKMENATFKEAIQKLVHIFDLDIDNIDMSFKINTILKEHRSWIEAQQKRHKMNAGVTEYTLPFTKYYNTHKSFTRFEDKTLEYYDAKFCNLYPANDTMFQNKLVIPIIQNNIIAGVALRDTTGRYLPKWLYQPKEIKIRNLLYNYDYIVNNINEHSEIILVEGIFDVWAYHEIGVDNVVAIFGSSIKTEQYNKILQLPYNVILSFDNDKAGNKCTKSAIEMFKNKTKLYQIHLPEDSDPADCSKPDLLNLYLTRTLA